MPRYGRSNTSNLEVRGALKPCTEALGVGHVHAADFAARVDRLALMPCFFAASATDVRSASRVASRECQATETTQPVATFRVSRIRAASTLRALDRSHLLA